MVYIISLYFIIRIYTFYMCVQFGLFFSNSMGKYEHTADLMMSHAIAVHKATVVERVRRDAEMR
jgi:hypothetical protein